MRGYKPSCRSRREVGVAGGGGNARPPRCNASHVKDAVPGWYNGKPGARRGSFSNHLGPPAQPGIPARMRRVKGRLRKKFVPRETNFFWIPLTRRKASDVMKFKRLNSMLENMASPYCAHVQNVVDYCEKRRHCIRFLENEHKRGRARKR